MSGTSRAPLAIVVSVLSGIVTGLITGILAWIKEPGLPVSERAAGAILRGGAACGATILLVLALFAGAGALR